MSVGLGTATQLELAALRVREVERDLADAREQLQRVVLDALEGGTSEAGVARVTGLSRTTVRAWRSTADAVASS